MKIYISIIGMLAISLAINAQLKVRSNGYVGITTTSIPLSPVSLNYGGNSDYYMSYLGDKNGFHCDVGDGGTMGGNIIVKPTGTASLFLGLRSRIDPPSYSPNNSCNSFGLQGSVSCGAYKYGVAGSITTSNNGAAVLGVNGSFLSSDHPVGCYAGYFVGNVKVKGSLTATNTLMSVPSNMTLIGTQAITRSDEEGSVTSKLNVLRNTTYFEEQSAKGSGVDANESSVDLFGNEMQNDNEELSLLEKQRLAKVHHGFDINKLSEVYPELVYEMEDGSQAVNYMEMIPLLVQSINELSLEIQELRGEKSRQTRSASWDGETAQEAQTPNLKGCVLYQNRPNPFSESTTIRFTLPEDAPQAFIYIFDMQGKMLRQIPVDSNMQSVTVSGGEFPAGIYLYSLVVGGKEIDTKRMILSK